MKNLPLMLVLFFLVTLEAFGQKTNDIDALRLDADVSKFWQEKVSAKKNRLPLVPLYSGRTQTNDSLGARNWIKTDFDGNGETDLLIFRVEGITEILVVLSRDKKYELIKPSYSNQPRYQFVYPVVKAINGKSVVLLYNQRQTGTLDKAGNMLYTKLECDTLVFKYGRVLNYCAHPQKHDITQIIIENNGSCEGDCPKTALTINAKSLSSTASKQEDWHSKVYRGSLSKKDIPTIIDLLNYADFPRLSPSYRVQETDQTTTTLTVVYDGGKKKTIKDYGSTGTFTLAEIYKLANRIDWVAVK